MAAKTVVLITGVGRGIGFAVASAYLSRPNHVVVGSLRDANGPQSGKLKALPVADGSKLLLVSIENTSATDPKKAVEDIKAAGVDHIDVVISNAGVSPPPAPLEVVDPKLLTETFNVNAVSTILLYQAVKDLLTKSTSPKWISISSRVGSISFAADFYHFLGAYGISKAAQDWFTATIHTSVKELVAFAVHPGFVYTDMGVAAANAAGIDLPATTSEESAAKLLETIDSATRETTSGKLIDIITGETIPW